MSLLSERALTAIRATVEKAMVDRVALYAPGTWADSNDDLESEYTAGALIGESKARIRPTSGPREQVVNNTTVLALRDADINIPWEATPPWVDCLVHVVSSSDPELEDRWFRVTDVRVFSQQASRQFSVVQHQRDRDWTPS